MKIAVIITSFNEKTTIGKAVKAVIKAVNNEQKYNNFYQIVLVAPDLDTLSEGERVAQSEVYAHFKTVKDNGTGKPAALNLAISNVEADCFIFTDGDVEVSEQSISELVSELSVGTKSAVGGHPVSADSRLTFWGYSSHLYCEAAHQRRLKNDLYTPLSGYLYIMKNIPGVFPMPEKIRSDDAYISMKLVEMGKEIGYAGNALVYTKFPKNLSDWMSQKKRSLGGNIQLLKYKNTSITKENHTRNINEDLSMALFPMTFAKNAKEYVFSILMYPLRAYLWLTIYFNHLLNRYSVGAWQRIESSKQ
ncbi:MAG: hypothetical protein QG570_406 [Patescibacteria group bacterium]|nr:hypothetical protein [Patescibacteria group bacterium]